MSQSIGSLTVLGSGSSENANAKRKAKRKEIEEIREELIETAKAKKEQELGRELTEQEMTEVEVGVAQIMKMKIDEANRINTESEDRIFGVLPEELYVGQDRSER